jgi:hypothetical protein
MVVNTLPAQRGVIVFVKCGIAPVAAPAASKDWTLFISARG